MKCSRALLLFGFFITSIDGFCKSNQNNLQSQLKKKYTYPITEHSTAETLGHVATVYGVSWVVYFISQPKGFLDDGSIDRYSDNLGKIHFDKDEPQWNWGIHIWAGSELYLYYRTAGYSPKQSIGLSILSSTLFEFLIENYTEEASVQDLFITPVVGSIVGIGLEKASLVFLNSGSKVLKFFGHVLNPFTLFPTYKGESHISPVVHNGSIQGLSLTMSF